MVKIAIIGGGAAGLMAAARIAELGEGRGACEVFVIERNNVLGKKVVMSGGGRCNLTTGLDDLKAILSKYPRGARFLRTAMYAFPPSAMREWVEAHGVPLKVEADMRVFPKSDNGMHVVRFFEKILAGTAKSGAKVHVLFDSVVQEISKDGDEFVLKVEGAADLRVDKVILCVGGQAYRHTGSQGDGYSFAEALGHSVTALAPSLNAFLLAEKWTRALAGLSFAEAALTFRAGGGGNGGDLGSGGGVGGGKFTYTGPMMFTHKGVTGPAVFALSAQAAYEVFDAGRPAQLAIDFFPGQNHEELKANFTEKLAANPKKNFQNVLGFFVPKSFADVLCVQLGIDGAKPSSELAKKDLNKVLDALKNMQLSIVGRVAGDEFVTAGGVALDEVDPRTMESKLCSGLYFAGEILDYDGYTGGFNLQAAWATGRLAGESAAGA